MPEIRAGNATVNARRDETLEEPSADDGPALSEDEHKTVQSMLARSKRPIGEVDDGER